MNGKKNGRFLCNETNILQNLKAYEESYYIYYNYVEDQLEMKVLVTGAFGNVGSSTLKALIARNKYEITCFDRPKLANRKESRKFKKNIKP